MFSDATTVFATMSPFKPLPGGLYSGNDMPVNVTVSLFIPFFFAALTSNATLNITPAIESRLKNVPCEEIEFSGMYFGSGLKFDCQLCQNTSGYFLMYDPWIIAGLGAKQLVNTPTKNGQTVRGTWRTLDMDLRVRYINKELTLDGNVSVFGGSQKFLIVLASWKAINDSLTAYERLEYFEPRGHTYSTEKECLSKCSTDCNYPMWRCVPERTSFSCYCG